jgi:hypothetical protein
MLKREKDGTHAFRKVDMLKRETQMKFSLSNCKWLKKIEYGLVFKAL